VRKKKTGTKSVTTGPDEIQFHRNHRDPDLVGMGKTLGHCARTAAQRV